jgi:transcriptional regulator with XRE-family HTH domain
LKKKTWNDVFQTLDEVPGVKEFMESYSVKIGRVILYRRLDLGWTQTELAQHVKQTTGKSMHQSTISSIEGGSPGITADLYDRVLRVLGIKDIDVRFSMDDKGDATVSSAQIGAF